MDHWQNEIDPGRDEHRYPSQARDDIHVPATLLPSVLQRLHSVHAQGAPPPIDALLADLRSEDWDKRAEAVRALGMSGDGALVELLLDSLDDEDASVRVAALHALGKIGERALLPHFIAAMHDHDWQVREAALLSLAQHKWHVSRDLLTPALRDSDGSVREAARVALRMIGDPGVGEGTAGAYVGSVQQKVQEHMRQEQRETRPEQHPEDMPEFGIPPLQGRLNKDGAYWNNTSGTGQEQLFYSPYDQPLPGDKLSSDPRPGSFSRRRVLLALLGLSVGAVATGGAVYLLRMASSRVPPRYVSPQGPHETEIRRATPRHVNIKAQALIGHTDEVTAVAWSPDGTRVASASLDKTVRVWDVASGHVLVNYGLHNDGVVTVSWSPDGKYVASASRDSLVHIWEASTGTPTRQYTDASQAVWSVAWSPASSGVASGGGATNSNPNTVQVWDALTGETYLRYQDPQPASGVQSVVSAISWSPDDARIASASTHIQVWDAYTGATRLLYRGGHDDPYFVNALAWSPDGTRIASCSGYPDRNVQIWDPTTGVILQIYRGHFTLAEAGANVFAQPLSSTPAPGRALSERIRFSGGGLGVTGVAWSPDGARMATCADNPDRTVRIWEASTGRTSFVYRGHTDGVMSVAWSPDGQLIACGSKDKTVQIWRA